MIGAYIGQPVVYRSGSGRTYLADVREIRTFGPDRGRDIRGDWSENGTVRTTAWVPESDCDPAPSYEQLLQLDLHYID